MRQHATVAACGLLAFACGPAAGDGPVGGYHGRALPEPLPKVDFTLSDTDGRPYDFRRETDGYVTLLFFGYTHCPDICPIHMANIGAVLDDFPFELRRQFKVVFVTTDPERDTPERLRSWLDNFDSSFIGLRGSRDAVNAIERALGLPPSILQDTTAPAAAPTEYDTAAAPSSSNGPAAAPADDGGYLVGHSAVVIAYTRDGLAHLVYPFGTRQSDWARDLPKLAEETWEG